MSTATSSSTVIKLPRIKEIRAFCGKEQSQTSSSASASSGNDTDNTNTIPKQSADQGADYHDVAGKNHWIDGCPTPIANPMSHYQQYAERRTSWGISALGSCIVEVEAETGETGIGISIGGAPACFIIEKHLSRFVEGQIPSSVELIHDQMMRATLNYGRKGIAIQAISAVDLAIYDLLGKLRKCPVYELLGGPCRNILPVYCTTSRPDVAKAKGFVGAKVPLPYGPSAGDEGLRKNIKFFADWREKVGDDFPLALDCYMSLTVQYSVKLCKQLAPYNPKWVEEFLPPDDYQGYKKVRQQVPGDMMLSTGEHEYCLKGFQLLCENECCDILQPDVNWCGGLTELKKIVALAQAHGKYVIPHGSSIYSYHLQFAFTNTPIAEFINLHPDGTGIQSFVQGIFDGEPLPDENGMLKISQFSSRAGFGISLKESMRKNLIRPYSRSEEEVMKQFEMNKKYSELEVEKVCFPF